MDTTTKEIADQMANKLSIQTPMQQVINPTPMQQVINPAPMQQSMNPYQMQQAINQMQQAINKTSMQQVLKPELTTKIINPVPLHQLIKLDRGMISMSDDNVMVKQIHNTHAPDGREFDIRPLFQLVEDILNRATLDADPSILVKH